MIVILFSVENAPLFITIDLDYNDFNLQQKEKKRKQEERIYKLSRFFFSRNCGFFSGYEVILILVDDLT